MNAERQIPTSRLSLLTLGVVATCCLVFNMLATPLHRVEVFLNQDTTDWVEIIILFGFVLVILFTVSSFTWLSYQVRRQKEFTTLDTIALVLGAVCILLLVGEKVMIDEIAREYRLDWEVLGEWIILYLFLFTQLSYNGLMLFRISRTLRAGGRNL